MSYVGTIDSGGGYVFTVFGNPKFVVPRWRLYIVVWYVLAHTAEHGTE